MHGMEIQLLKEWKIIVCMYANVVAQLEIGNRVGYRNQEKLVLFPILLMHGDYSRDRP